ncbi:MAG TPA: DUF2283 domain-containing protein [Candidatus Acidoferrum sp.]|nr:DUF2283 domain-containing protein [Candidatus Acidoferrum sp.]
MPDPAPGRFPCPWLGREVDLPRDRELRIEQHHPDLLPARRTALAEVLADPEVVRRGLAAGSRFLFSRRYTEGGRGRHVIVVVDDSRAPAGAFIVTAYAARALRYRSARMTAKLTFHYDRQGYTLHISSRPPYAEQETEELGDDVIARLNPETGDIESLEILSFSVRLQAEGFELPVSAALRRAD